MEKKIVMLSVIALSVIALLFSCKKNGSTMVKAGNVPHDLSDTFYMRALIDTTWIYYADDNAAECQINGGVCASFVTYGNNNSVSSLQLHLTDSANPAPKDSIIKTWVGKTFVCRTDTSSVSHAYEFSMSVPDTLSRSRSTDNINNTGSSLTITSITRRGDSHYYFDSITPYKAYKIKGTLNCKLARFNDATITHVTQGVYSVNVIEAK